MLLNAENICKAYRTASARVTALESVSLAVDAGELVGIVGQSGSGKTTLASILIGLETADAGTVTFEGICADATLPPGRRSRAARATWLDMQMVFQHPAASFSPRMRIGTAVAEGGAYRGLDRSLRQEAVRAALEHVGLPAAYERRYAHELSGGECQRAALARAIVVRPKLLICDEPTSALDVTVQDQVVGLIRQLCAELGMACLFISHNLALVQALSSRAYVMDAGRIVEEGPTDALFSHPQAAATQRLIDAIR